MKTIEEKAKAYDEALERAKAYHRNELVGSRKEMMEYIFPQLRESEDERTRKALIQFLNDIKSISERGRTSWAVRKEDVEMCNGFITYLEKQKEQKPIDYPYLPGWRKNRDNNKPELKRSVLMLTTHGVAEGEWLGEKWCQYRWSCELKDGEVLYWIHLSDLERLEKEGEEKQKEQKPAEWNEENKKMIEHIVGSLTSLKRYIQDNISFSEDIKEILERDIEREQDWLKSFRPSWKPSEEQMKALQIAAVASPTDSYILSALYEQLKKL